MRTLIFCILALFVNTVSAQTVLPFPQQVSASYSQININNIKYIFTDSDSLKTEIKVFNEFLQNASLPPLSFAKQDSNCIILTHNPSALEEEYSLSLEGKNILIAGKKSGVFYGLMTAFEWFTQQNINMPKEMENKNMLRNNMHDFPAYSWRGMHLDVCRHFFPTGFIKKYIDILAMHKMNTFHWHLTDDQGWRIEIKKYPLLTQVGSKRAETMVDKHFDPYLGDHTPVEGFYTQEQIADVVKYAALRHVTIVPEIEMPGHAQAALAAYPAYSCSKEPTEVMTTWGVSEKVFCTDNNTIQFLKDVLDEVMAMFPSQYIHIGGDEVPKASWKACAVCEQTMKRNRLKNEDELQSYFIKQIDEYVTEKGRSIIGWDEILDGGLAPNAAVMSWRGTEGGIAAAKQKHFVVMSPGSHLYFDHYQTQNEFLSGEDAEPLAIGGYTPIEKVYAFEPTPKTLTENEKKYILGAQANVWTEYIPVSSQVEYMALPRLCALSEVLWTGDKKPGFDNFSKRLRVHLNTLKKYNIYYANSIFDPEIRVKNMGENSEVSISSNFNIGKLYYTTNGNTPTIATKIYDAKKPLILAKNTILKVRYIENKSPLGKTMTVQIK